MQCAVSHTIGVSCSPTLWQSCRQRKDRFVHGFAVQQEQVRQTEVQESEFNQEPEWVSSKLHPLAGQLAHDADLALPLAAGDHLRLGPRLLLDTRRGRGDHEWVSSPCCVVIIIYNCFCLQGVSRTIHRASQIPNIGASLRTFFSEVCWCFIRHFFRSGFFLFFVQFHGNN